MKFIVIAVLAFAAIAASAPVESEPIQTIRELFDQRPEGGYDFDFETQNGILRKEEGQVKEVFDEEKKPHNVVIVRGSYQYIDNDGNTHSVTYVADENGYNAQSDDIPVAPAARR